MKNNHRWFFLNMIVIIIFLQTGSIQSGLENTAAGKLYFSVIGTTSLNEDFCVQLKQIMDHAHTNFQKIATEEEQPHEDQREGPDVMKLFSLGYKASLKFPGAKLSSVTPGLVGADSYEAYFGSYKTAAAAEKKIDSIKIQLTECLKNYKIKKEAATKDSNKYSLSYIFDEKRTDKTAPQHVTLIAEEDLDWGDDDTPKVFKVYVYIYGLQKE